MYILNVLSVFFSYHAIIDLSCCAETSHAVSFLYTLVVLSYTFVGILSSNVTLSIFSLCIFAFPKNSSWGPSSVFADLKVL